MKLNSNYIVMTMTVFVVISWQAAPAKADGAAAHHGTPTGQQMQIAQAGGGLTNPHNVQQKESGQGTSPQGGQGAATQVGTPPAQLQSEENARRRAEEASAASSTSNLQKPGK
ncbi:hypothetical protein [Paraburkholderia diazotrophica]|uniref:Uncharacterized protein n=1 Tax=Paraburkholderia diazotrophica TaxID=667676 RepID=A0A1H7EMH6_9BURK|nr:hypothetical protein [Paraburkholderia diazotrophica]SEK12850.1 hypothetical protein SAMN05192539_106116 [Paraburkholderia diazotrophica]